MPVSSLIVIASPGESESAINQIKRLDGAEVIKNDQGTIIVVTDTETAQRDTALVAEIGELSTVDQVFVVFSSV